MRICYGIAISTESLSYYYNKRRQNMKSFIILSTLILVLAITSCEGPIGPEGTPGINGTNDKQIRLEFGSFSHSTSDTSWIITYPTIINFKKEYFVGVDSIIFVVNMGSSNLNTNCVAELFNLTDSISIQRSTVLTNDTTKFPGFSIGGKWCYSANVYNNLPAEEITLGVRFKSDNYGNMVNINEGMLLLYRE